MMVRKQMLMFLGTVNSRSLAQSSFQHRATHRARARLRACDTNQQARQNEIDQYGTRQP
jgi:hypothetical protein